MHCVRLAKWTELLQFQLMRDRPFIFRRCIISLLTLSTGKCYYISHEQPCYPKKPTAKLDSAVGSFSANTNQLNPTGDWFGFIQ